MRKKSFGFLAVSESSIPSNCADEAAMAHSVSRCPSGDQLSHPSGSPENVGFRPGNPRRGRALQGLQLLAAQLGRCFDGCKVTRCPHHRSYSLGHSPSSPFFSPSPASSAQVWAHWIFRLFCNLLCVWKLQKIECCEARCCVSICSKFGL